MEHQRDDPFDVPLSSSFNHMLRGSNQPSFETRAQSRPLTQVPAPAPAPAPSGKPKPKSKCPPYVWALVVGLLVVLLLVSLIFVFVKPNKLASNSPPPPSVEDTRPPSPSPSPSPVSKLHKRVLENPVAVEYYNHAITQGMEGEDADIWALEAAAQFKMQQQQPQPQPQRSVPAQPPAPAPAPVRQKKLQQSLAQMLAGTDDPSELSSMVTSQTRVFGHGDTQPLPQPRQMATAANAAPGDFVALSEL